MRFHFNTDSDRWAVVNALNVAMEKYKQDALDLAAANVSPPLVKQFEMQAADAMRIRDQIVGDA